MGSGLPQFGFPRRFAIDLVSLENGISITSWAMSEDIQQVQTRYYILILRIYSSKINSLIAPFLMQFPP
jgi:hypothetical protein